MVNQLPECCCPWFWLRSCVSLSMLLNQLFKYWLIIQDQELHIAVCGSKSVICVAVHGSESCWIIWMAVLFRCNSCSLLSMVLSQQCVSLSMVLNQWCPLLIMFLIQKVYVTFHAAQSAMCVSLLMVQTQQLSVAVQGAESAMCHCKWYRFKGVGHWPWLWNSFVCITN